MRLTGSLLSLILGPYSERRRVLNTRETIVSTAPSTKTWFVQVNSQVCGPLNITELRELIRAQVVTAQSPVSRDGKNWQRVLEVPELCGSAGQTPSIQASATAVVSSPSRSMSPLVLLAVAAFGVVSVLLCSGAVLGLLADHGAPSAAARPGASPGTATTHDPVAEATYQYWMQLKQIAANPLQPGPAVIAQLATTVARVEGLPVVNVDSDLVAFAYDFSALLRAVMENGRRQGDVTYFVECFLRGFSGDFLGPLNDQVQTTNSLQSQLQALDQHEKRLRAVLSQRYGFEFPPL